MIIQWLRKLLNLGEHQYTKFELEHYAAFEKAVQESDVVAYTFDDNYRGGHVILKGNNLNPVNAGNLVSFYRLNRAQRRKLDGRLIVEENLKQA